MPSQVIAFPQRGDGIPPVTLPETSRPPASHLIDAKGYAARSFMPSRREYGLGEVARLTGLSHVSHKVLIASLRKLAVQAAMPLPKSPRWHKGKLCSGPDTIGARSRWDALLFDDWLDDRGPHGGAGVPAKIAEPPVTTSLREDMAARAATLASLGRKRA